MIDPPRTEAIEAVALAKRIRTVMITGDHINTASAIAKQIGILNEGEKVLSGKELTQLSDQELAANIELTVFMFWVSPTDKIRIVKVDNQAR